MALTLTHWLISVTRTFGSARCLFMASMLTVGMTRAAPVPRAGQSSTSSDGTEQVGANAELLAWCIHGRNGAGVPCASQVGDDAGSPLIPLRVRRGYMASRRCA